MNKIIAVLSMVLILGACGMTKEKLGLGKNIPDETMVSTRKPLSVPPEYDLRPVNENKN